MSRWTKVAVVLLILIAFSIPIEYEYNKLFRHLSKTIIPEGLVLPQNFNKHIVFFRSDLAAIFLFLIALFGLRIPLRQFFFEKKAPFLWALLFFSFFSILCSPLARYPLLYIQLIQLITPLLLFSLCANGFNSTIQPQLTRWILTSFVLAGLIQTSFALIQYFSRSPLGMPFLGEPQYYGSYDLPSGHRWIFDQIFHYASPSSFIMRAHGTFFHANVLGSFLMTSLFASYSLILELKKPWLKNFFIFSLPIQFFAMSVTFSRAAIFGWILGTCLWFGLFLWQRRHLPPRFFTAMVAFSPIFSISLLWEQFSHRGGIINYNAVTRGSDATRLAFQNNAFSLILKKPFFGHGHQEYALASQAYGVDSGLPHNIYILLFVETGFFSLLTFLIFFALLFRAALRSSLSPQTLSLIAILFAFFFIGGCDAYPLRSQEGRLLIFITAGLLAGHCFQRREYAFAK